MSRLRPALLFAIGWCAARLLAGATPEIAPAADPGELQRTTLPNGFRCVVLRRTAEPGRISLRLIVHAGSLDEHGDELGFAHFVEHMAFNGTRHYPPGKLMLFFQRNGLAWGVDASADTSLTHTTYKLDLPAGRADQFDEALQVLRDYADGIEFAPAEVKRERGVIVSELTARDTNTWQVTRQRISALYSGSAIPTRLPVGNTATIKQATAFQLRAFYQRCYRPERMTLLVVGDVTNEAAMALIEKNFASLAGVGPSVAPVLPDLPRNEGLRAHVIASATSTAAAVILTGVVPVPTDAEAVRAADRACYVVGRALDRRLNERQRQLSDKIGRAFAGRGSEIDGRFRQISLEVHAKVDAWPAAVALIENEFRRARENGFSAEELREMSASLLAGARAARDAAPRVTPDQLANEIADSLAAGVDWQSPVASLGETEAWVARFAPADAAAALQAMFPEDRLHLLLMLREPGKTAPADILAAYRDSAARPLAAVSAPAADELRFRYADFGPVGLVTSHRTVADLQIELVEFANGARLNLRASDTEPHHFKLVAYLGRGIADAPRDRPGLPFLGGMLLGACDLHRHTRGELGRLIRLRAVEAGVTYALDRFAIELQGPSTELPFALRFVAAYLSDLKFEEAKMSPALSNYAAGWAALVGSSQTLSRTDRGFYLHAHDPRFRFPPLADVARYPFAEVVAWVQSRWLDGPIEIALAGDFDPQAAIDATATTIGALPTRHEAAPIRGDERVALPAKLYRNLSPVPLADHAATVQFAWTANDLANVRVKRALLLANDGLVNRLRGKLRDELGVTYDPLGDIVRDATQPDFGFADIEITFEPKRAQALSDRVLKLADEFARQGLTLDEFSRVREPRIAHTVAALRTNAWWLEEVLARAQSQPALLDEARTAVTDFASLTLKEVNRAAATHYRLTNAHVVGVVPAPAK